MFWRLTSTLGFETWLDMFFGYGLIAAEFYALIVLIFGYVQTAWPLRRTPVWLTTEPEEWPTVDVFIPPISSRRCPAGAKVATRQSFGIIDDAVTGKPAIAIV